MSRRSRLHYLTGLRLAVGRHGHMPAYPAGPACTEVHLRSMLRFAASFFPTTPRSGGVGPLGRTEITLLF